MASVALSASAKCGRQLDQILSQVPGTYLRRSTFRKTTASRLKYLLRRSCWETEFFRRELEGFVLGLEAILFELRLWSGVISPFEDVTLSAESVFLCLVNPPRVFSLGISSSSSVSRFVVADSHSVRGGVGDSRTGGIAKPFVDGGNLGVMSTLLGFVTIGIRFAIGLRWP